MTGWLSGFTTLDKDVASECVYAEKCHLNLTAF